MTIESSKESKKKDKTKGFLWGILILAVILRLGASVWLGDTLEGAQQVRVFDQHSYQALAESILAGKGYSFDKPWYPFRSPAGAPTAHWSFVYPLYLSAVYAVAGPHPLAARLVQVVIVGLLTIWLVFRIGRRLFGENVGLIAAFLTAVYPYFVFHDATLMTEPFFISAVLASLELSMELVGFGPKDEPLNPEGEDRLWKWVLLGAVLGVAALLRQTILLWVPFLLAWILIAARKQSISRLLGRVGLTLLMLILFVLPWTIRNYRVYQSILPLNSNAGYALYSANHPHHGTQFDQDFAAELPADLASLGLNDAQWNSELTRRGIQFVLDDPIRYILLSLDRIGIYFNFWFSKESSLSSNLLRVFSFGLYLPFFIFGLILSWPDRRRCSLIYLFGIVFSLLHILTWASVRYRLPVDAAFMPFAGLAVWKVFDVVTKAHHQKD